MGERFGNYEILRRLAAGGMAEVLLAKHTGMGGFERLVCLKRILPHLSAQEDFLKMFQDEARIAANLMHPNIAQIYDIAQEGEHTYIAMEYVRGEDLRRVYNQEVARGQTIPRHVAAQVIMGAAAGLDYAHRQADLDGQPLGIVHRDVSPQNIVVTYNGHVKIIDFGVAKAAGKLNQTRSGVLKGKYSYMSPEQASGDPVDGRTDIFALGITLYEITCGTRLFKRENELETLHAVIACNVTPPSQVVPKYDRDLEAIVLKALAYDADNRYQTAGEMEHDLERYLLNHGHPTSASHLAQYMHDLFADKLADEALFGGPPWSENLTPSVLVDDKTVLDPRQRTLDEKTVVDADAAPPPPPVPRPPPPAKAPPVYDDWRSDGGSPERTPSLGDSAPIPPSQRATMIQRASRVVTPVTPAVVHGATAKITDRDATPPAPRAAIAAVTVLVVATLGFCGWVFWKHRLRSAPPAMPVNTAPATAPEEAPTTAAPVQPPQAPPANQSFLNVTAPIPLEVTLGNRLLGDTPLRNIPMEPGTYRLKLENKQEGLVVRRNVRLDAGGHTNLDILAQKGALAVSAKPWAWVQIGTHPAVETPQHLELLEGEYTVVLECPDGRRKTESIRISGGGSESIGINCEGRR